MSEEKPEEQFLIGSTLGPCRLESILGRGGMGVVYRAHHIPLDRAVAVKIPSAKWLNRPGAADTLLMEARSVARLEDPRIVQVYDVGQEKGLPYIIMQLIEGETLEQRVIAHGPLGPKDALGLIREVTAALGVAHRQGIVHRDLKPSNILIDGEGRVRLTDFGIAQPADAQWHMQEMIFSGSHHYMAPEQAFGWEPDVRSDLYALGAVYYYALTGAPPFTGHVEELIVKHREEPVPDARVVNREVTEAAAELIKKMMSKAPEQRPANIEELLKSFGAAGMLLDVDSSGSPFKLLPAPVEEKVGFVPPQARPEETTAPIDPGAIEWPPPPPEVPFVQSRPDTISRLLYLSLYALIFGPAWRGLGPLDWIGASCFAAAAAGVFYLGDRRPLWRKTAGAAAVAVMAVGAVFLGLGGKAMVGNIPSLELGALLAIGMVLAFCSYYLGLIGADPERGLALVFLTLALAALLFVAAVYRLPPESSWPAAGAKILRSDFSALAASGGLVRWGGLALLYAGSWIFFPPPAAAVKKSVDRVINWNV